MSVWILLHGLNERPDMFEHWKKLPELFPCICPSLPPFGGVTIPESFTGTMDWFARYVIDQVPAGDLWVAGHSMGGYIGLAMAKNYPDRVKKLVLLNSTAAPDAPERRENRNRQLQLLAREPEVYFRAFFQVLLPPDSEIRSTERYRKLVEQANHIPLNELKMVISGLRDRPDMRAFLREQKGTICHYVVGQLDALLPAEQIREEAAACGAGLTILEHSGHLSPWEASAEVEELLCHF